VLLGFASEGARTTKVPRRSAQSVKREVWGGVRARLTRVWIQSQSLGCQVSGENLDGFSGRGARPQMFIGRRRKRQEIRHGVVIGATVRDSSPSTPTNTMSADGRDSWDHLWPGALD
jgi:hypothetical protein